MAVLDGANKLNGHVVTPLFEHLGASSWHKSDAKLILRLGKLIEHAKGLSVEPIVVLLSLTGLPAIFVSLIRFSRLRRRTADLEAMV